MANALEIGGAIGEGLSASMGRLQEAVRQERSYNSPQAAMEREKYQQYMQEEQRKSQPISINDIEKRSPVTRRVIEQLRNQNNPLIAGKENITTGQLESFTSDPNNFSIIIPAMEASMKESEQAKPFFESEVKSKGEKLSKILGEDVDVNQFVAAAQANPALLSDEKKKKAFEEYMNASKSLEQQQAQYRQWSIQKDHMVDEINASYKGMSKIQLIDKANRGDQRAASVLSELNKQETDEKADHYTIRKGNEVKSIRLRSGESIPKGWEIVTPSQTNQPTDSESNKLAQSMAEGKLAPNVISKRGKSQAAVFTAVKDIYPNFDFSKAQANYDYMKNPNNLRSMGMVKAAMPRVDDMEKLVTKLNNYDVNIINKPLNAISKQVGEDKVTNYESLRNAIIQEINTALSGSSVPSDYRIKLEMEQLGADRSPAQLKGAIRNLRKALEARMDASRAVPYDWNEVKGITQEQTQETSAQPVSTKEDLKKLYGLK